MRLNSASMSENVFLKSFAESCSCLRIACCSAPFTNSTGTSSES